MHHFFFALSGCTDDNVTVIPDDSGKQDQDKQDQDKEDPDKEDQDKQEQDKTVYENPKRNPSEPPKPIVLPDDNSAWKNPEFYEVYSACAYSDPALDKTFITIPAGAGYDGTGYARAIASFKLMKREVTRRDYAECVDAGICGKTGQTQSYDSGRMAVGNVSAENAENAEKHCKRIGGRLPTYAEWMHAASYHGDSEEIRIFPWGNRLPYFCVTAVWGYSGWICVNGKIMTQSDAFQASIVGCYPDGDSYLGLQDMGGNVLEWVYDEANNDYIPVGGSMFLDMDYMMLYGKIAANRTSYDSEDIGFRCATDIGGDGNLSPNEM